LRSISTHFRRALRFPLPRHMRLDPGGRRIAAADQGADRGIAGARLGAVKAMDITVAVAGLAAAFLPNRNPRLPFRHHSNLMNGAPPPPGSRHAFTGGSYPRPKAGG